ncbi:hypothetical protein EDB86DRAFT_2833756 [Lactarius hatsudake]|nr:hypothetical protein EDB86DRAFT_2833756 [Lactarius hatsudake]
MTTTVTTVVVTATVGAEALKHVWECVVEVAAGTWARCRSAGWAQKFPLSMGRNIAHITAIPSQVSQPTKMTSCYHHHHNTVEGPTRPAHTPNSLNDVNVAVTRPQLSVLPTTTMTATRAAADIPPTQPTATTTPGL